MRISDWSSDVCSSDLRLDRQSHGVSALSADLHRHHPRVPGGRLLPRLSAPETDLRRGRSLRPARAKPRHQDETLGCDRSEERRVGKEGVRTCRSRWSPYHYKKNKTRNRRNKKK